MCIVFSLFIICSLGCRPFHIRQRLEIVCFHSEAMWWWWWCCCHRLACASKLHSSFCLAGRGEISCTRFYASTEKRRTRSFFHFATLALSHHQKDKWDPINDCHNFGNLFRCIFLNFNAHNREHSISFVRAFIAALQPKTNVRARVGFCGYFTFSIFSISLSLLSAIKYFNFLPFVGVSSTKIGVFDHGFVPLFVIPHENETRVESWMRTK